MIINFPKYANDCLKKIETNGFEAWFVGGCVRDSIIGREFYDIDITTNALPKDIERIFDKTVPTGIKHGTVTVITENHPIEVTTYRSEYGYTDNRHPSQIKFEDKIESDLSRRDFTVNALAYNPKFGILDLFGGLNDINNRIIRAVNDPKVRFSEDALRILRAFRFASQLNFEIEKDTYTAAIELCGTLKNLSGERILSELKKLASGKKPYILNEILRKEALIPFGIGHSVSNYENIFNINENSKPAALIFQCKHEMALLKNKLKADKKLLTGISSFSEYSALPLPNNKAELKLLLNRYQNISLYLDFIKLTKASSVVDKIVGFYKEIEDNNEPYLIGHLELNGDDLLAIGIPASKIGKVLKSLTEKVIYHPELNTKERLTEEVKK